ncbi:MAG: putative DNA binding domain-containing protein [Desulfobacterales bacterium]|nr:putative DNA binding domain-containing protein [Desulfobacterales bacterium]
MISTDKNRPAFLDQPESRRLEFKESFPKGEQVARTAVAFANGAGGKIVFGVKDSPREIVGIPDDILFQTEARIASCIFDLCAPGIVPEIYIQTDEGKSLLVAEIYPGSQKPYGIKKSGRTPEVYIRVGASNRKADTDTIQELERRRQRISFDALTVFGCPMEAVDLSGFIRDFKARTGRQLDKAQLFNLGLFQKETDGTFPTNAALLLSDSAARKRFFGHAKIECARFKGTDKQVFLDQATIDAPVHAAVEPAMAFIKKNIALGATIGEIYRKDRWEYPIEAMREALVNAIIHRDYAASGADIKVAIYDDMLEITSPGPLPDTLPVEELGTGRSEIRNRVLAPIFKDLKLIEAWGSGIQKMRQELTDYPEIELVLKEAGHVFQVQFTKKNSLPQSGTEAGRDQVGTKQGPSRDQVGTKQGPSRDQVGTKLELPSNQYNILKECLNPISMAELMKATGRSNRTKFKKSVIDPLLGAGLLEMTDPSSPNSPKQKYRITDKGQDFINRQE